MIQKEVGGRQMVTRAVEKDKARQETQDMGG